MSTVDTSSAIAHQKAPLGVETFATTAKRWTRGKRTNQGTPPLAAAMGIELLTEEMYEKLQELGEFDTKTSSWLLTPPNVRKLGGAIFGDRRFGRVFAYHNGAESYYKARGFRGSLTV